MKRQWIGIFLMLAIGCSFSLCLTAQSNQELKARFLQRKPFIDKMKDREDIGENNLGSLTIRGNVNEQERKIVEEENADRRIIYMRIAKRLGVPVEEVGRRRALKIARMASPGHWLQAPKGNWYRK